MVILGVATSVAWESRQRRQTVRIAMAVPADVQLANGTIVHGVTTDMSSGGVMIRMERDFAASPGESIQAHLARARRRRDPARNLVGIDGRHPPCAVRSAHPPGRRGPHHGALLPRRHLARMGRVARGRPAADQPRRIFKLAFHGLRHELSRSESKSAQVAISPPASLPLVLAILSLCVSAVSAQVPSPPNTQSQPETHPAAQTPQTSRQQLSQFSSTRHLRQRPHLRRPRRSRHHRSSRHRRLQYGPLFSCRRPVRQDRDHAYPVSPLARPDPVTQPSQGKPQRHALRHAARSTTQPCIAQAAGQAVKSSTHHRNQRPARDRPSRIPAECWCTTTSSPSSSSATTRPSAKTLQLHPLGHVDNHSTIEFAGTLIPLQNDLKLLPAPFYDPAVNLHPVIPIVFLANPRQRRCRPLASSPPGSAFFSLEFFSPAPCPPHSLFKSSTLLRLPRHHPIRQRHRHRRERRDASAFTPDDRRLRPHHRHAAEPLRPVLQGPRPHRRHTRTTSSPQHGAHHCSATSSRETQCASPRSRCPPLASPMTRRAGSAPKRSIASAISRRPADLQTDGAHPIAIYMRLPPDLYYDTQQNLALHLAYRYNGVSLSNDSSLQVSLNDVVRQFDSVCRTPTKPRPTAKHRPSSRLGHAALFELLSMQFLFRPQRRRLPGHRARQPHGPPSSKTPTSTSTTFPTGRSCPTSRSSPTPAIPSPAKPTSPTPLSFFPTPRRGRDRDSTSP